MIRSWRLMFWTRSVASWSTSPSLSLTNWTASYRFILDYRRLSTIFYYHLKSPNFVRSLFALPVASCNTPPFSTAILFQINIYIIIIHFNLISISFHSLLQSVPSSHSLSSFPIRLLEVAQTTRFNTSQVPMKVILKCATSWGRGCFKQAAQRARFEARQSVMWETLPSPTTMTRSWTSLKYVLLSSFI